MTRRGSRLAWRKTVSASREDEWAESLGFLGGTRVAITSFPGGRRVRLEAFSLSKKEAAELTSRFGGSVREVGGERRPAKTREPIRIRRKLMVVDSEAALSSANRRFPGRESIAIPAGAAFGTGEHATTATCLRLLCDVSGRFENRVWELLDLGTGSGILAIAASKLGAARAEGWDFDVDAIRTARENARANGVTNVALKKGDVTGGFGRRRWEVVCANLYSEVLIGSAGAIAGGVRPGGCLIVSGILREQEDACVEAFERRGVELERRMRSGKWAALLWRKAAGGGGGGGSPAGIESPEKLLTAREWRDR